MSVHKPLLSDGDLTDTEGFTILTAMRTCFQRVCEQYSWNGAIDLTKERGVYNLYVQVAGGDGSVERAVEVSPNQMEVDELGHGPSEGLRLVNPREMGVPSDGGEEALAPSATSACEADTGRTG